LNIAISGNSRALRRHVVSTLEKLISEYDDSHLIIELVEGMDADTMLAARHAIDWAQKTQTPYRLAMDPAVLDAVASEYAEAAMKSAVDQTRTTNISRLLEAGDVLVLGWDEEDEGCMRALVAASKRGVKVYDTEYAELVMGDPDEDEDDDFEYDGEFPDVWLDDSVQREIREIQEKIMNLIERQVRLAVETKTRVRTSR